MVLVDEYGFTLAPWLIVDLWLVRGQQWLKMDKSWRIDAWRQLQPTGGGSEWWIRWSKSAPKVTWDRPLPWEMRCNSSCISRARENAKGWVITELAQFLCPFFFMDGWHPWQAHGTRLSPPGHWNRGFHCSFFHVPIWSQFGASKDQRHKCEPYHQVSELVMVALLTIYSLLRW